MSGRHRAPEPPPVVDWAFVRAWLAAASCLALVLVVAALIYAVGGQYR